MNTLLKIGEFYIEAQEQLQLLLLTPEADMNRFIRTDKLNNPGLELAGFWQHFLPDRIQILTIKELNFLNNLTEAALISIFTKMFSYNIPALICICEGDIPKKICQLANDTFTPVFISRIESLRFLKEAGSYLYSKFAPRTSIHGTLIDIYGVGVLLTGRSGIGKSEIALDLVERGHRLVADDLVNVEKTSDTVLMGYAEKLLQDHIEIRGVGIINIRKTFGIRATRTRKRIEVQIELSDWNREEDVERFGLVDVYQEILDVDIPFVRLPIYPGKNVTVIAEVVALNHLLKLIGEHPAQELQENLTRQIKHKQAQHEDFGLSDDFE
ncbi:MAG TPA: HPr(Ser) kinase/phosphatase [Candidatus Marinimicrobia bacterium]|nr:HPr(Ser) kinase/phosphatase [Candidatus Neomarinimicrobiota bacterium]